jgi:hypothetical protein
MPTPATPDRRLNRDEDMKPGRPPRPASEPRGSEGSAKSEKTATDPATGEPGGRPPRPT